jgi:hypothetical protein
VITGQVGAEAIAIELTPGVLDVAKLAQARLSAEGDCKPWSPHLAAAFELVNKSMLAADGALSVFVIPQQFSESIGRLA